MVFQARTKADFKPGELVLVPYVSTALVDFEDTAKLRRPKAMHPHLPFVVACDAGAVELADTARFFMKSPLAAGPPEQVAAPLWAVPQAPEGNEDDANMKVSALSLTLPETQFSIDGASARAKGKKPKPTPLTVTLPVFVSTKDVLRGTAFVFSGSLSLDPEEKEEEE